MNRRLERQAMKRVIATARDTLSAIKREISHARWISPYGDRIQQDIAARFVEMAMRYAWGLPQELEEIQDKLEAWTARPFSGPPDPGHETLCRRPHPTPD